MTNIYNDILSAKATNQKLLAILLDPDKINWERKSELLSKINQSPATHLFIGGSEVATTRIDELVLLVKKECPLPVILFPGNPSQISKEADGILFLSLISGRNPDYLIEHQVNAVPMLKQTKLEVIPTGYILIESGHETAVARISKTNPLANTNLEYILQTAQAGELLGNKLIYLEAGSGAKQAISEETILLVSQNITIPLIVGGGIKQFQEIRKAQDAGADLVVIGTAFENDFHFFDPA
jgi:putative glycerol-1-phosphate prenyltransferase